MSATNPDQTPASHPAPSTVPAGLEQLAWLRWCTPAVRRMIFWLGAAAIGTGAMGSAVNHFFAAGPQNTQASVTAATGGPGSVGGTGSGMWWNPVAAPLDTPSVSSSVTTPDGASSSSPSSANGGSIIPVDRSIGFSSGSLMLNTPVPISVSSQPTYAVLGLGMRSFSGPSLSTDSANTSELHFSLGGDVNLAPVDNLATGSISMVTLTAVPEPSTVGMLAAALAGLAVRRRRKSVVIA